MKAVILAAGKGTRMMPLTKTHPKPMLRVDGLRTLLDVHLDMLTSMPEITEIIIVIGYLGEIIEAAFKSSYRGVPIRYVEQKRLAGTYGSLGKALDSNVNEPKFLVMTADDIQSKEAVQQALACQYAIVTAHVEDARPYGLVETEILGLVLQIKEKPTELQSGLVFTGVAVLDGYIFERAFLPEVRSGVEMYLTEAMSKMANSVEMRAIISKPGSWFPITTPGDLDEASKRFAFAK